MRKSKDNDAAPTNSARGDMYSYYTSLYLVCQNTVQSVLTTPTAPAHIWGLQHHTGRSSQLPMVSELRCTTRKNTNDLARGRLGMGRNAKPTSRCLVNVAPFVRVVRVVRINKCLPRALYSFRGRNYFRMAGKDGRCSVVGPIYGPVRSG